MTINTLDAYQTDALGFLKDFRHWDENFAETTARKLCIPSLTREHWDVINYIRNTFETTGRCPTIFETAKNTTLHRRVLKKLFPTGYLRGACLIAGITYREGFVRQGELYNIAPDFHLGVMDKIYKVDVRGFLADHRDWDDAYAVYKAHEMKIPGGQLTPTRLAGSVGVEHRGDDLWRHDPPEHLQREVLLERWVRGDLAYTQRHEAAPGRESGVRALSPYQMPPRILLSQRY